MEANTYRISLRNKKNKATKLLNKLQYLFHYFTIICTYNIGYKADYRR